MATSSGAAQHPRRPSRSPPRPASGSPSALFSGTKKPPARTTRRSTTRLKIAKPAIGDGGVERDPSDAAHGACQRLAAAPARPGGRGERAHGDRPGFVAGQAREREHPADTADGPSQACRPAGARAAHRSAYVEPVVTRLRPRDQQRHAEQSSAPAAAARSSASTAGRARSGSARRPPRRRPRRARESVSGSTIHAIAPAATANADDRDRDRRRAGPVERDRPAPEARSAGAAAAARPRRSAASPA